MKHIPLRCIPAALLAAALLAGCGAQSAPPASVAVKPAESKQSATLTAPVTTAEPEAVPETATEAENTETPRITEQISLEKQCSAGYTTISVHLPKLESDSADAARINQELWEMGAPYLEQDPNAILEKCFYTWDATWYGDCVSIVVTEEDPTWGEQYHWCFDFKSGTQLTNTQLLERMGADPLALENALRRQVMHTFDAAWDRLGPETNRTQWPYTPEAQKNFRWKQLISVSQPDQLDDLPLLLDTEGSAGFLVLVYYADTRQYRNTRFDLPLDAVAVPADWQQRVLGQWTVYRTEVDEDVTYPEESGEQYTLKLEAGDSPDTVRATLTRISKYGDTTTEIRTGVLTRGSVGFAFEGECWQIRCLRPDDENYEWAIALREDGTMTMANMGGNAEYSYISWMDLRRS
jgi:hypothetical protein